MERKIIIYRNNATHTEEMKGDISNFGQLKNLFVKEGIDPSKYDIYKIWGGKSECITNEINSYEFPDTVTVGRSNKKTSDLYFSLVKKDKNIDTARSNSLVKIDRAEAIGKIRNANLEDEFKKQHGKLLTNSTSDEIYMFLYKHDIEIRVVDLKKNGGNILRNKVNQELKLACEKPVDTCNEPIAEKDRVEGDDCKDAEKPVQDSSVQAVTASSIIIAIYDGLSDEHKKAVREHILSETAECPDSNKSTEESTHDDDEEDMNQFLMEATRNILR